MQGQRLRTDAHRRSAALAPFAHAGAHAEKSRRHARGVTNLWVRLDITLVGRATRKRRRNSKAANTVRCPECLRCESSLAQVRDQKYIGGSRERPATNNGRSKVDKDRKCYGVKGYNPDDVRFVEVIFMVAVIAGLFLWALW